jgi:hypothetical protein
LLRAHASRIAAAALAAVLVVTPGAAWALDPFEIQVYDGTADEVGHAGLELHLNHWRGSQPSAPPVLPLDRQTHATLEPSYGVLPFVEVGAYLQTALLADGSFEFAGAKARVKLVTPEGWHEHLRLGANFEVSALPERFEAGRWGGEIRPIFAWDTPWVLVAANPNLELDLSSAGWRQGPALAPGVQVLVKIPDRVGLGAEYYAELGPIAHLGRDATTQYLFGVAQLLANAGWELNLGVGFGLTSASEHVVLKAIVGRELFAR